MLVKNIYDTNTVIKNVQKKIISEIFDSVIGKIVLHQNTKQQ